MVRVRGAPAAGLATILIRSAGILPAMCGGGGMPALRPLEKAIVKLKHK